MSKESELAEKILNAKYPSPETLESWLREYAEEYHNGKVLETWKQTSALTFRSSVSDIKKWEYETFNIGLREDQKRQLLLLGNEGWELVSVVLVNTYLAYYFKRLKPIEPPVNNKP